MKRARQISTSGHSSRSTLTRTKPPYRRRRHFYSNHHDQYDVLHIFLHGLLDIWRYHIFEKWLPPIDQFFLSQTCYLFHLMFRETGRFLLFTSLQPYMLHPKDHHHDFNRYFWLLTQHGQIPYKCSRTAPRFKVPVHKHTIYKELGVLVKTSLHAEQLVSTDALEVHNGLGSLLLYSIGHFAGHQEGLLPWLLSLTESPQWAHQSRFIWRGILSNRHISIPSSHIDAVKTLIKETYDKELKIGTSQELNPILDGFPHDYWLMDIIEGERLDLLEWLVHVDVTASSSSRHRFSGVVWRIAASGSMPLLQALDQIFNTYKDLLKEHNQFGGGYTIDQYAKQAVVPDDLTWYLEMMAWIRKYRIHLESLMYNEEITILCIAVDYAIRLDKNHLLEQLFHYFKEKSIATREMITMYKSSIEPNYFTAESLRLVLRYLSSSADGLSLFDESYYRGITLTKLVMLDCIDVLTEDSYRQLIFPSGSRAETVAEILLGVLYVYTNEHVSCLEHLILQLPKPKEDLLRIWQALRILSPFPLWILCLDRPEHPSSFPYPAIATLFAKHKLIPLEHALPCVICHRRVNLLHELIRLGVKVNNRSLCRIGQDWDETIESTAFYECQYILHTQTQLGTFCQCPYMKEIEKAKKNRKHYC